MYLLHMQRFSNGGKLIHQPFANQTMPSKHSPINWFLDKQIRMIFTHFSDVSISVTFPTTKGWQTACRRTIIIAIILTTIHYTIRIEYAPLRIHKFSWFKNTSFIHMLQNLRTVRKLVLDRVLHTRPGLCTSEKITSTIVEYWLRTYLLIIGIQGWWQQIVSVGQNWYRCKMATRKNCPHDNILPGD